MTKDQMIKEVEKIIEGQCLHFEKDTKCSLAEAIVSKIGVDEEKEFKIANKNYYNKGGVMKTCTEMYLNTCPHKTMSGTGFNCGYSGYCDFQRPRDSRGIQSPLHDMSAKQQETCPLPLRDMSAKQQETCPWCHLPIYQCKGHTICDPRKEATEKEKIKR